MRMGTDHPDLFHVDLSGIGAGISSVVFSRDPGGKVTALHTHLDDQPISFQRRPDMRNPRSWITGALAAGATALALRHRRGRRAPWDLSEEGRHCAAGRLTSGAPRRAISCPPSPTILGRHVGLLAAPDGPNGPSRAAAADARWRQETRRLAVTTLRLIGLMPQVVALRGVSDRKLEPTGVGGETRCSP